METEFRDQLGRCVRVKRNPERIISLVPSQTELLYVLGLGNKIVGHTVFCVHPHLKEGSAVRIGGTKNLNIDKILALSPDLILANKEENTREQIEILAQFFPVWISDVQNIDDALSMIASVGMITNTRHRADQLIHSIRFERNTFKKLHPQPAGVVYLIWNKPYMAAGSDTFIHSMIADAGFVNLIDQTRYPVLDIDEMIRLNPEYVLLSSEPFPFNEKHADIINRALAKKVCVPVDGTYFSWYGSRLAKAYAYFADLHSSLQQIGGKSWKD